MKRILTSIATVASASAFTAGVWWLFYWLWNEVVVGAFGAPELTFWQAAGVFVLAGLLLGGLRAATK